MWEIEKMIRKEVLALKAYNADVPACRIKLDANENPFTVSDALKEAIFAEMKKISLNRYPEAGALKLREKFARHYGVGNDMIMIGNGSDEFIQVLMTALGGQGRSILIPVPTFSMYRICGLNNGFKVLEAPLDNKFDLDEKEMLDAIARENPAVVFLSYPNNPTGNCFSRGRVEAILEAAKGIVVVDEAYGDFSGQTFLPDLGRYDNLVIFKTLSKVGMAAMRVGILIGTPAIVRELDKVRLPYNLNTLSQIAAGYFVDCNDQFKDRINEVISRRKELFLALQNISGIKATPSDANFIFFSCNFDADQIYNHLLKRGILIRNLNSPGVMKNCMRVTVGNYDENREFIEALKSIVK